MKKKDVVYYARIIRNVDIYDVIEMIIRTVEEDWFVGIDKRDKHAYLFSTDALDKDVFYNRKDALNKVKIAEKNRKVISNEVDYEEY